MIKSDLKEILVKLWLDCNNIFNDKIVDIIGKLQNQAVDDILKLVICNLPEPIGWPDGNDICVSCKEHIDNCNCNEKWTWNDCIEEMKRKLK